MEVVTDEKTVRFQLAQLLGQRGFRNFANLAAQRSKAGDVTAGDIVKDFQFPFAAQDFL